MDFPDDLPAGLMLACGLSPGADCASTNFCGCAKAAYVRKLREHRCTSVFTGSLFHQGSSTWQTLSSKGSAKWMTLDFSERK